MGNLALGALILFGLLIPGFIASYRYYATAAQWESSGNVALGIDRVLCWGLLLSLVAHCIWQMVVYVLHGWLGTGLVDYGFLLSLATDPSRELLVLLGHQVDRGLLFKLNAYLLSQVVVFWFIGTLLGRFAEQFGWNSRLALRSPGAFWHKVLRLADDDPDFVVVSIALTMGGANYLYRGLLHEYQLSKEGDLHRVVLLGATRVLLRDNRESDEYEVPGEYLSINCDAAQSLNVDYLWLAPETTEEDLLALPTV